MTTSAFCSKSKKELFGQTALLMVTSQKSLFFVH